MSQRIHLGAAAAGVPVYLDLPRLLESRLLLQANSGGGKSWALRRLLEQSHGHVQHLVLDIEGEFHTLREKYDYVLAARSGGDTLADVRTAPLLARRLLELGVSAILDLYELQAHDRIRFVKLFLEALIDAPRSLWHKVLVVVDEAHVFCPEGDKAESAAAVIDLMTRGRKRGFCGVLATQRLSKLHKSAAAEANVKLIGRASLDVDIDRAAKEIGFSKQDIPRLRTLRAGRFFAFGPGLSDQVIEIAVGPVETTHPKPGQGGAPVPPPREKVRAALAKLADLPREAEEEARTAAELRVRVAQLQRELAAKPKPPEPPAPRVERVEVPMLSETALKRLEGVVGKLETTAGAMLEVARELSAALRNGHDRAKAAQAEAQRWATPAAVPVQGRATPPPAPVERREKPGQAADGAALTGPEQRILDAIAWLESIGQTKPEQNAVAFMANYAPTTGSYQRARGSLGTAGLIVYDRGRFTLTEAGRAKARPPVAPPTPTDLQARVLSKLAGPERRVLQPLLDAYPQRMSNTELAAAAGYEPSTGSYQRARGRLGSIGLIEYRSGEAVALPVLFLEN